jgi:hypothetical protein
MTGAFETGPAAGLPIGTITTPVNFAEGITLLGYQVEASPAPSPVNFILYWQSANIVPTAYTIFIHLFDANGDFIAQHDSPPAQGQFSMLLWSPGVIVTDIHPIE